MAKYRFEIVVPRHPTAPHPWNLGGLSVSQLASLVWQEIQRDDLLGRAAQLAFYFVLSLFPALLFLTALLGQLPRQSFVPELLLSLREVLPEDALSLVERYLDQVQQGSSTGILSLGFLGALWASSRALTGVIVTLNIVYGVREWRPPWKRRLLALVMTIGLAAFTVVSTAVVLYGEHLGEWVAGALGLHEAYRWAWAILRWPLVLGLMLLGMGIVYHLAPNVRHAWRWVWPGALFAVVMWLVVSLAFKLYVEHVANYNLAYGSLGGVIVLMLWLYLGAIMLLIGGEINAEIEKAAHGRLAADGSPGAPVSRPRSG